MIDIYAGLLMLLAIIVTGASFIALKRSYMKDRAEMRNSMLATINRIKSEYNDLKRKDGAKAFAKQYEMTEKIKSLEIELQDTKDKLTKAERKYAMLMSSLEVKNEQR